MVLIVALLDLLPSVVQKFTSFYRLFITISMIIANTLWTSCKLWDFHFKYAAPLRSSELKGGGGEILPASGPK